MDRMWHLLLLLLLQVLLQLLLYYLHLHHHPCHLSLISVKLLSALRLHHKHKHKIHSLLNLSSQTKHLLKQTALLRLSEQLPLSSTTTANTLSSPHSASETQDTSPPLLLSSPLLPLPLPLQPRLLLPSSSTLSLHPVRLSPHSPPAALSSASLQRKCLSSTQLSSQCIYPLPKTSSLIR